MSQPTERRQFILDTEDEGRILLTARLVAQADGTVVFTDVQDFQRIPRPNPEHGGNQ
ncbi:hypothetical protein [Mycolicibacterium fortuitum]|uniref:Uncharacterized protein n=1 Tax=Mycolicibacterium fortuitum TaxID=1766 RepID=A0AAE4V6J4_MYCFO|nr:hypothetical protein [Mycolicibacterium fortuitum]MDV7194628.1 hypothetical protein [Mycolicibacterium fortuitum]MDV7208628.1 hypothetical protein [Mycolicibacterium fortuitum]MDV7230525.1 hypothetical protein [Mycolicibacterium fortuitum]MDV7261868.1 hypothetical protein [Mycolicibacterium fortuitum]MDV7287022.1 hypothetical protein [Mycolicibacterium fortuitum]